MEDKNLAATLKAWKTSRKLYLEFFKKYTPQQLNKIPEGFNNNLIWNIGHVIVAQQALIYRGSGVSWYIPDELFERYKPGTKPTGPIQATEINELEELLVTLIESTIEDLDKGRFITYNERVTGTGFHLASLEDALVFNNYHEGLHLGYMMNLRKFV